MSKKKNLKNEKQKDVVEGQEAVLDDTKPSRVEYKEYDDNKEQSEIDSLKSLCLEKDSKILEQEKVISELEKALAYYKDKEEKDRVNSLTSEQKLLFSKTAPENPLVSKRRLKQRERLDRAKIKQVIETLSSIISKQQ